MQRGRGNVRGRITATSRGILIAASLVLAACGPSGQPPAASGPAAAPPTPNGGAPGAATSRAPVGVTPQAPGGERPSLPAPTLGLGVNVGAGPAAVGSGQPRSGGRVIWGDISDIKTLNPVLVTDTSSDATTLRIFAPLLSVDAATGAVQPGLAEQWDFAPDGKTLTFQLRDGLTFSDGSPLTGDDFKFSVMAVLRSQMTNLKNNVDQIVGAREYSTGAAEDISGIVVNGKTISVSLVNAFCPALAQIGNGISIIPRSVYGKYLDPKDPSKNLDQAPENNAPPVASGAFQFKEWLPNDHLTLVRNDHYWQKANIDEWVHKVYPNQDALTAALTVGEVDMAQFDAKDAERMRGVNSVQVFKYPNLGYTFIGWNELRGGKEFFQDKTVRQALAYGLNVDQVIDKVLFGEGVKMLAHTPPPSWAYDTSGLTDYQYDPARAEQLLQQDGWARGSDGIYAKHGQKLAFSIVTNAGNVVRETLIQVAAEQYRQIGIDVQPRTESFEALVDRLNTSKDPTYGDQGGHDFDAFALGWGLSADPDMYSIWDSNSTHPSENNVIQFKNAELDRAIDDSRSQCSPPERKAAIKRANQILNDQQPYDFGFANNILLGASVHLHNLAPGPFARFGQAKPETWWVQ